MVRRLKKTNIWCTDYREFTVLLNMLEVSFKLELKTKDLLCLSGFQWGAYTLIHSLKLGHTIHDLQHTSKRFTLYGYTWIKGQEIGRG